MEIEQTLLEIRDLENQFHAAEIKRDNSIEFYQRRIADTNDVFKSDTYDIRIKLENLYIQLKDFYDENPPIKGKSHKFAGGKFGYSKQPTKFFVDGKPATSDNPALINYVKSYCPQFLKYKELVDWSKLKDDIYVEDETAYRKSTGEVILEIKVQNLPDKFSVKVTESPLKKALDLETLRSLNAEEDDYDETD